MIILGIDPGLAHTGWGVVETRGSLVRARAYGCIASSADEPIDMRLYGRMDGAGVLKFAREKMGA